MLIFVHNGVEDSEFIYPYYHFQEEGYQMDIVSVKAKEADTGKHGVPFVFEIAPEQVRLDEYDAVIIPWGHAPDRMRINKGLVDIVKEANQKAR